MSDMFRFPWPTPFYTGPPAVPSGAAAPTGRMAIVTWASLGFPASGSVVVEGSASLSGQGDLDADGFVSKIVMSGTVEAEAALFAEGLLTDMAGTVEAEVDATGAVFQQGRGAEVVVSGSAVFTVGVTRLHDTFTGGNGGLLENHVADSGNTWAAHPNSSPGVSAIIQSNRVTTGGGIGSALYYADYVDPSANYVVQATIRCVTNASFAGIMGRVDPASGGTGYILLFANGTGWRLGKLSAGNFSFFATGGPTSLTVGQDYVARLEMEGSTLRGFVDGVLVVSATDATVTQIGRVGIRLSVSSQALAGYHIDTIDVLSTQVGATMSGQGTLTASGTVIPAVNQVTMAGVGTLVATGKQIVHGAATMSGQGSLTARGGVLLLAELDAGGLVLVPMGANGQGLVPMAAGSFTLEEQEKR